MQLYAIIKIEDTEYRVSPGGSIKVDRLQAEPGSTMEYDSVSKIVNGDNVAEGKPWVNGARVRAHVKKHGQENGVIVFKMGRRQLYKKKHDRQWQYTVLKIDQIDFEDNTFSKRDVDPRKIRKAQAAIKPRKPRAQKPPPPKPEPRPNPVVETTPPVQTSNQQSGQQPTQQSARPKARSAEQRTAPANRANKKWLWPATLLVLMLLGFFAWQRTPTPEQPVDAKPAPAEVHPLDTRKIGRLVDPTQPPD
jgi:large subunit ribosomal protein L21